MITSLDHIQISMPVGGEDAARAFYSGLLGIPEIDKPAVLAVRGGVWFQCGAVQLHLGADSAFAPAKKAHPALCVEGWDAFTARLQAAGVALEPAETVNGRARANLFDPFGNRVELIEKARIGA